MHKTIFGTGVEAFAGGLITVGKTVVPNLYNGQLLYEQLLFYFTLLWNYKCRDDDGPLTCRLQHNITLHLKEHSVAAMTDKGQLALCCQYGAHTDERENGLDIGGAVRLVGALRKVSGTREHLDTRKKGKQGRLDTTRING